MNKICTDVKQSKKLIELEIDVNTADMFYADIIVNDNHKYILHPLGSYGFKTFSETKTRESKRLSFIPAWSLSALIKMLPDKITIDNETYYLSFDKKSIAFRGPITWDGQKSKSFEMDDILDAVFEMIVWLKENKKI